MSVERGISGSAVMVGLLVLVTVILGTSAFYSISSDHWEIAKWAVGISLVLVFFGLQYRLVRAVEVIAADA